MVEKQYEVRPIKAVRSDNGTEFNCMKSYFDNNGILFQTSCVHTPQQNGRVERKYRHILNVARALMFQAHVPVRLWGECVLAAVYLINRTPSDLLGGKTPHGVLTGVSPLLSHLWILGCLCFAYTHQSRGDKFSSRSRKRVFLGYPHGKKGWKLYDWETGEIFVSRDVQFHEDVFPFMPSVSSVADGSLRNDTPLPIVMDEVLSHLLLYL
ncbi:unnamed protein product [Cuscuta europaea]|uniref:Integrase catalytic domain-containing protein n=1 Tax=Cuscuta europaea TaxID=41803 RepID=A0A9P0ZJV2_CUSEU|nr:unnamed protein product [Cuscuta europaea]